MDGGWSRTVYSTVTVPTWPGGMVCGSEIPPRTVAVAQRHAFGSAHGGDTGLVRRIPGGERPVQLLPGHHPVIVHHRVEHDPTQMPCRCVEVAELVFQFDAPGVIDASARPDWRRAAPSHGLVQIARGAGEQAAPARGSPLPRGHRIDPRCVAASAGSGSAAYGPARPDRASAAHPAAWQRWWYRCRQRDRRLPHRCDLRSAPAAPCDGPIRCSCPMSCDRCRLRPAMAIW